MTQRVLIVDDDVWLAQQYQRQLQLAGYHVELAANGLEAIDAVDAQIPSVIILDMFMPGPNGFVLLHELQSHDDLATIPVVLCSNMAGELPPVTQLAQYGVRQVLDKTTMQPRDLTRAIQKVLA